MRKMQTHTLRQFSALLLALAMAFALVGCGGSKTFDASGYVDASLKLVTTGDAKALEAYKGDAVVDTEDTYKEDMKDIIQSVTGELELSDSNMTLVEDMMKELLGNASYTVGEAKENEDGSFDVPLTVKPLQLNIADKITEWIQTLDAEKINDMDALYGEIFQMMKTAAEKKEYAAEKDYTLHVKKNDEGLYNIADGEVEEIEANLFTTDLDSMLG